MIPLGAGGLLERECMLEGAPGYGKDSGKQRTRNSQIQRKGNGLMHGRNIVVEKQHATLQRGNFHGKII